MKLRDSKKLADKSTAELQEQLGQLQRQLGEARQSKKVGKLANPRIVSMTSDAIARMHTILRQRSLTAEVAAE